MNNKICIIGVYFGELPNYVNLWMKSAAYNSLIDFYLVTDQIVENLPANVILISMSIEEVEALAAKKLEITDISIKYPYKCCDFRPAYGVIFEDYIRQYEYWGNCDFDMIFGDLSLFFEKYNLYDYDRFLTLGHLTLYRNTVINNSRYKCEGSYIDYKTVFTTNENYAFDEYKGITRIYQLNGFSQFTKRIFIDVATGYKRFRISNKYPFDTKPKNYKKQLFVWEKGKVYHIYLDDNDKVKKEEYAYIHFQKRPNYKVNFNIDQADRFVISNEGFIPLKQPVDAEDLEKYNIYPGFAIEIMQRIKWLFKKAVSRFLK